MFLLLKTIVQCTNILFHSLYLGCIYFLQKWSEGNQMIVFQIATKPLIYWIFLTFMLASGRKRLWNFLEGLYRWEPVQFSPFIPSKLCVAISWLVTVLAKTLFTLCYSLKSSDSQLWCSLPGFRSRLVCLKD